MTERLLAIMLVLMSPAHRIGFALLGLMVGSSGGAAVGLLAGLAHIEIQSRRFEGYAGFVVAFWILGGTIIGAIAGLVLAYRWVKHRIF